MAAIVLHNHNQNPYYTNKDKQNVVIFSPTTYHGGLLVIISPIALRVMITLAIRLNTEGYAAATLDELARFIQTPRSYVNKGVLELAKNNLIKKKKRGEYWINPKVFRPATVEIL